MGRKKNKTKSSVTVPASIENVSPKVNASSPSADSSTETVGESASVQVNRENNRNKTFHNNDGTNSAKDRNSSSFVYSLLRYFISGTIVILPLVVTVAIVLWLSNFFIQWFGPSTAFGKLLSYLGIRFLPDSNLCYYFGWSVVLIALFLIGLVAESFVRKRFIGWFDLLIKKIPVIGKIYGTTRKFTDLMDQNDSSKMKGMTPVYCRFGERGGGTLILALMPTDEEYEIEGNPYRVVIIPTAPVPFGGGMFFIPSSDIIKADMTIDAFMSFYVSMGVTGNNE